MRLPDPCYKHLRTTGSSHEPIFTISCTVASEHSEGSANKKKIAKQDAAKNMLEHLPENKPIDINYMNEIDMKYKNLFVHSSKSDTAQQDADIMNKYSKMKELPIEVNNTLFAQHYHIALVELCRNISENQKHLMIPPKMEEYHLNQVKGTIQIIQDVMKAPVRMIEFQSKHSNQSIVGLRLSTTPVLFQIGLSNDIKDAEKQAVYKMLQCIVLYMK